MPGPALLLLNKTCICSVDDTDGIPSSECSLYDVRTRIQFNLPRRSRPLIRSGARCQTQKEGISSIAYVLCSAAVRKRDSWATLRKKVQIQNKEVGRQLVLANDPMKWPTRGCWHIRLNLCLSFLALTPRPADDCPGTKYVSHVLSLPSSSSGPRGRHVGQIVSSSTFSSSGPRRYDAQHTCWLSAALLCGGK